MSACPIVQLLFLCMISKSIKVKLVKKLMSLLIPYDTYISLNSFEQEFCGFMFLPQVARVGKQLTTPANRAHLCRHKTL